MLALPAVAALLERHPRDLVVRSLRDVLDEVRSALMEGGEALPSDALDPQAVAGRLESLLEVRSRSTLRPVINATGVILHTNLGRSPLSEAAITAMAEAGPRYTNLEFGLDDGLRGSRYDHCRSLLCELTGAEDGLVVNNAAAALILALDTAASGRGVVVSRGELIEIGGGFRIPEIVERAGTRLVEVGTTNRTRLADYRAAVKGVSEGEPGAEATARPGAVLKVHRSNFRLSGFTEETSVGDLSGFCSENGLPLVYDLGSGLMADLDVEGLPREPTVREAVASGADVVLFSGDKLMGGPQAGLIVGRADWVKRLRANPLCRALRVDKVTLAGLEATLRAYRDPERARMEIPVLRMIHESAADLEGRARGIADRLGPLVQAGHSVDVVPGVSVVGGGTLPDGEIAGWQVAIRPRAGGVTDLQRGLRLGTPAVVGRTEDDRILLDPRTVDPSRDEALAAAVLAVFEGR